MDTPKIAACLQKQVEKEAGKKYAFGLNVSRIKNLHLIPRQISIAGKAERLSKVKNTGELGTFDFFSSLARTLRYVSIVRASALAFSSHPPSQGPPSHFLIHYQARSANGFISRCRVCFCAHRGKFKSRQDLFNAVAFAGAAAPRSARTGRCAPGEVAIFYFPTRQVPSNKPEEVTTPPIGCSIVLSFAVVCLLSQGSSSQLGYFVAFSIFPFDELVG